MRLRPLAVISILILASASLFALEGRLFFNPDLSGSRAVFTFENDLWVADVVTGTSTRITSHPGKENHAHFSPDGQWLAFSGNYDGGRDVYLMPVTGGEPKRLTYHPYSDVVQGFSSDGEYVLFTSRRDNYTKLYRVSIEGGFPETLPLDRVRYASFSPDNNFIAYNRENADRMNWKGYKGGQQQDIWVADLTAGTFNRMTSWEGYDISPMWYGGTIYFSSDRKDKRMNLYGLDTATGLVTRITHFTQWDVEMPSLDESTGRIIYLNEGHLRIYDPSTGTDKIISITVPTDRWQMRNYYVDPAKHVHSIALNNDGSVAVVESRGDIFLIDDENEKTVNLTDTSGSRELEPVLSPDGELLAFFSDRSGEFELYTMKPEPGAEWKQVTQDTQTFYYHILWSPDSKRLLFGDKNYTLQYASVDTGTVVTVDDGRYLKDNEIFWEIADYHWSPDSRFITYALPMENMNSAIYIYDTESGEKRTLTDGHFDDYSPVFDGGGRYLYFLSNRNFKPALDVFMDNNLNVNLTKVMMVQLSGGEPIPFTVRWKTFLDELNEDEEKDVQVTIDWEGIEHRLFSVPVEPGTYKNLEAGKLGIWYLSRDSFGFPGIEEFFHPKSVRHYTLHHYDLKEESGEVLMKGIGSYQLSADGAKFSYRAGKQAGIADSDQGGDVGDGSLSWFGHEYTVDTSEEYTQILRDVWRQIRDFFYDPDIHGKEWEGIYNKYSTLLPYVATREDINYLISQMVGELTASHEYVIGRGQSRGSSFDRVNVGLLGADITLDPTTGLYIIQRILTGRSDLEEFTSPFQAPDVDIAEGMYILKIDGREIRKGENIYSFLEGKAGKEISLTVNRKPTLKEASTFTVKTLGYEGMLRYWDWVHSRSEIVKKATDNRIGYIHLSNMDEDGLSQFEEGFRADRYKDGLIIDVRYNGGGFVSWFMIDKLERAVRFLTQTRDFEPMYYPHSARRGPIVVICNQGTGSDGEVFTQHFQEAKLGTVVGTRTWGGLIGIINMIPLIDGGMITQSNVGFANLKGSWVVENHGAEPDIVVEMPPEATLKGEDPQLDYAIDLILKKVQEEPPLALIPPAFPVK